MQQDRRNPYIALMVGIVLGAIAGLVIAPVVGMLITEDSSTMSGKEQGFVGFMYGVYWGPVVGAVIGAALAWHRGQD
jgi:cytochrome c biogenesis protein CcdA